MYFYKTSSLNERIGLSYTYWPHVKKTGTSQKLKIYTQIQWGTKVVSSMFERSPLDVLKDASSITPGGYPTQRVDYQHET